MKTETSELVSSTNDNNKVDSVTNSNNNPELIASTENIERTKDNDEHKIKNSLITNQQEIKSDENNMLSENKDKNKKERNENNNDKNKKEENENNDTESKSADNLNNS